MSTLDRLVNLLRPWLCQLPVSAGLEELARKWELAARSWEDLTHQVIDQRWMDGALYEACRLGENSGQDLAWIVAYSTLVGERAHQSADFVVREVEVLRAASVAAVTAHRPDGAFARARQVGRDRAQRPVPRDARKSLL